MRRVAVLCALLFSFGYGFCAESFTVNGTVIDAVTKEPLPGVSVKVKEGSLTLTTDDKGAFSFTTTKKAVNILVAVNGYQPFKKQLSQPYGPLTVELDLATEYTLGKIVVKDNRNKVEGSKQKVTAAEIKKTTAQLFSDSVKVLQTLPGVTMGDDFSALMYVRGGDYYECVNFLDNVHVLMPYLWGGAMSVYNPNFVDKIDFYSGGFPAKYPQALSGVIDVHNIEGDYEKRSGFVDASVTTFELFQQGPMTEGKSSYVIGFRRTYYDLMANAMYGDKYKGIVFPFFYDMQSKLAWKLTPEDKLTFDTLSSYEGMDFHNVDAEEQEKSDPDLEADYEFHYSNLRLLPSVNWERTYSDSLSNALTLSSRYYEGHASFLNNDAMADACDKHVEASLRDRLTYIRDRHTIEQGLYYYNVWINSDYKSAEEKTDPLTHQKYTDTEHSFLDWRDISAAGAYVQDDIELLRDRFFVNIGGLVEHFAYTNDTTFCPRGGVKYNLTDTTTLKFNTGLYSEFPIYSGDIVKNDDIKAEKAIHYVAGLEQELPDHFFFRLEGYVKDYSDVIVKDPDPALSYTNGGTRRTSGVDVFVQRKISSKWDGWLSYSYLDAQDKILHRSDITGQQTGIGEFEAPVGQWYPFEKERKHNVSLVLNYEFTPLWMLAATYHYATGTPYTDITGADYYAAYDTYVPRYGSYMADRTHEYHRLDLKLSMPFFRVKNTEFYVQIINVLGSENVDSYYYNKSYSRRYTAKMMPTMPIAGFKYKF